MGYIFIGERADFYETTDSCIQFKESLDGKLVDDYKMSNDSIRFDGEEFLIMFFTQSITINTLVVGMFALQL
ncbi:hypothetical protein [Microbulbifer spongiae]|uniref:Uncharacterized protein n=1 Tax=Microbulbifer spongiae TaxID=2944933 RepID=A0ABY9EA84_9GAMM|nr:hypothetical protein [Microbulbifer sp. MI-G]WKD48419.1 hypothetical protein M8T91_10815 [Microbulbifer sp. MI-G]